MTQDDYEAAIKKAMPSLSDDEAQKRYEQGTRFRRKVLISLFILIAWLVTLLAFVIAKLVW